MVGCWWRMWEITSTCLSVHSLWHMWRLEMSCECLQCFLVFCTLLPHSRGCFSFPMLFSMEGSWFAIPASDLAARHSRPHGGPQPITPTSEVALL